MMNSTLDLGTRCPECGQRLFFDIDGEGFCQDCTRWTCSPVDVGDAEELVDLWACARGEFSPDDDSGVIVPIRPATCWKCDGVRDCGLDPCPICGADAV